MIVAEDDERVAQSRLRLARVGIERAAARAYEINRSLIHEDLELSSSAAPIGKST